jgi:hypothetical protein
MKVTFICGCETKEIIARENIKTMDMVEFDTEGFLICAIHHQRRYGWRSLPTLPGLKLSDWSYHDWTPREIEAWLVFGEAPNLQSIFEITPTEDRRDNRDPESLVTRVTSLLDRAGNVHEATPDRPFYIYSRVTEPRFDHELQVTLDEFAGSRGGRKVLPWPSHIRDYDEAFVREKVRAIKTARDARDQA